MASPRASIALLALVLLTAASGHNGGCHADDAPPLPSPVNAVATVLEHEDGVVEAQLSLWSRSVIPAAHVEGAGEVTVDGIAMTEIAPGRFRARLDDDHGDSHTFSFVVSAATARRYHIHGGRFRLAMHGPLDRPDAWLDGDTVRWTPAGMPALVQLLRGQEPIYASFDGARVDLDSEDWRALAPADAWPLPPEALAEADRVRVCGVEVRRRDDFAGADPQHLGQDDALEGRLGWLSGAIVGRCRAIETVVR